MAEGMANEAFAFFLFFYYTAVLGLSGALAGQAILIALLFDAVTDPLVGVASDRTTSRFGRRHPFLYAAALPVGLCFYAVFAPPAGLSQLGLFAWLAFFAVATRAAMTLFHVPHLALGAELSDDYEERTAIVTLQFLFTRTGHAIAGILAFLVFFRPTPVYSEGRFNPAAYPSLALTLALLMTATILISAWKTQERVAHLPSPDPTPEKRSLFAELRGDLLTVSRNPSFRALVFGLTLTFTAWGVTTALGLHLATYFWFVSNEELVLWGIAMGTGIFLGLPIWRRVAKRIDKKPTFVWGLAVFTAFTALPPLLLLAGFWPARGNALYVPLWALSTGFAAHFGIAATMVTGRSMMADVTDEDALAHGRRREGVFFGAVSFAAKASFGIGGLVAGIVVSAIGLRANQDPATVAPEVIRALGLTLGLSILFLCGVSLIFFSRYRITREDHAVTRAALERRGAEGL